MISGVNTCLLVLTQMIGGVNTCLVVLTPNDQRSQHMFTSVDLRGIGILITVPWKGCHDL